MNLNETEGTLLQAYEQEVEQYTQALAVARRMALGLAEGRHTSSELARFSVPLDEVARLEAGMAAAKQRWQQSGRKPGPQLLAVLGRLTSVIEELSRAVHDLEGQAEAHKARIAPELDSAVRARQMARAYGAARHR